MGRGERGREGKRDVGGEGGKWEGRWEATEVRYWSVCGMRRSMDGDVGDECGKEAGKQSFALEEKSIELKS